MAAPSVTAVVTLKSGEQRSFQQEVNSTEDKKHYQKLRESLKKVQEDVNACLTQQVELERVSNQAAGHNTKVKQKKDQGGDSDHSGKPV